MLTWQEALQLREMSTSMLLPQESMASDPGGCCSARLVSYRNIHWDVDLLEQHMHSSMDTSTTNDDRIRLQLLKYIARD